MRIIQISDIHIPHEFEVTHDIPIRENLARIFTKINSYNYDAIVITGDLAYKKGSRAIYEHIQKKLSTIHKPIFLIPGNHDSVSLLKKTFPDNFSEHQSYYSKYILNTNFIFLDTSQNIVDTQQLLWLKAELETRKNAIIFMHHPPCYAGVEYMDSKHALQNQTEVLNILYAQPNPISIFCGHYHVAKEIITKNLHVYICPSTYYQINPVGLQFSIGSKSIGFRIINILNETIQTEVVWL